MKERRGKLVWLNKYAMKFLSVSLVYIGVLVVVNFYVSWKMLAELQQVFNYSSAWRVNFIILQVSFLGIIFTLLVSLFLVLHRSLGPLLRIERILENVLKGDYSLRITVRRKDIIRSLADKINQLIEVAGKGR
jgi:signal transduction histidine kinase